MWTRENHFHPGTWGHFVNGHLILMTAQLFSRTGWFSVFWNWLLTFQLRILPLFTYLQSFARICNTEMIIIKYLGLTHYAAYSWQLCNTLTHREGPHVSGALVFLLRYKKKPFTSQHVAFSRGQAQLLPFWLFFFLIQKRQAEIKK